MEISKDKHTVLHENAKVFDIVHITVWIDLSLTPTVTVTKTFMPRKILELCIVHERSTSFQLIKQDDSNIWYLNRAIIHLLTYPNGTMNLGPIYSSFYKKKT